MTEEEEEEEEKVVDHPTVVIKYNSSLKNNKYFYNKFQVAFKSQKLDPITLGQTLTNLFRRAILFCL